MHEDYPSTVCIVGLGYIGLPTAAMFASRKIEVIGVDIRQATVDTINEGKIHIAEPELEMIVHAVVTEGYLTATTKPQPADAFLVAVPTPFKDDHEPDLAYIEAAASSIAPVLRAGDIVILESTSPVGTTEKLAEWLAQARPDLRFAGRSAEPNVNIAYCPERVLPGHVVRELVENDRIIGGMTTECSKRAADVYRVFVEGQLFETNVRTAEMAKLTENAFRDVNIALANELSLICERLNINAWELIKLANRHPRVNILQPGCGVGGHCIAVDPWFIIKKTPDEAKLIHSARLVNDGKPNWIIERIITLRGSSPIEPKKHRTAVLGLAYKPNIDDLRESPALQIATTLQYKLDNPLLIVEPNIAKLPPSLEGSELVDIEEALSKANLIAILVAHNQFADIRKRLSPHQLVVDAVGMLDNSN